MTSQDSADNLERIIDSALEAKMRQTSEPLLVRIMPQSTIPASLGIEKSLASRMKSYFTLTEYLISRGYEPIRRSDSFVDCVIAREHIQELSQTNYISRIYVPPANRRRILF